MSLVDFCAVNDLIETDVDASVLDALISIHSIEDVVRSSIFQESNKEAAMSSFQKAECMGVERVWITQGIVKPLVKPKTTTIHFGHPFDAAPTKFLQFKVHPDRRVIFQMRMTDPLT